MQTIGDRDLLGRTALERLLGAGIFYFTDNSGRSRESHIRFACGCSAHESEPDRFALAACERHRDAG